MVFTNSLSPILFSIGPIAIHWYGILYALGVLVVYFYARHEIKAGRFKTTLEHFDSFFIWAVIAMVVGARLFEVIFYNPGYYLANPLKIIFVWEGGLSFHGGLIGAVLVAWYWCKKKSVSFLHLADVIIIPAAFAQALGRLGNFFNGELLGRPFSGAWAVITPAVDSIARHPVQIYEIFYNLVVFGLLFGLRKKNLPAGSIFSLFLISYSVFRFITEFFKEPVTIYAGLPLGQWLSIIMAILGVWLWFWIRRKTSQPLNTVN